MIDNILYATSSSLGLKLLTLDKELKEFIRKRELRDVVLLPEEVIWDVIKSPSTAETHKARMQSH
jgi:hypothetical protein